MSQFHLESQLIRLSYFHCLLYRLRKQLTIAIFSHISPLDLCPISGISGIDSILASKEEEIYPFCPIFLKRFSSNGLTTTPHRLVPLSYWKSQDSQSIEALTVGIFPPSGLMNLLALSLELALSLIGRGNGFTRLVGA